KLARVALHAGSDAGLQLAIGGVEELLAVANAVVAEVADGVDAFIPGDQLAIDAVSDHRVHRAPGAAESRVLRAEIIVGQRFTQLGAQLEELRRHGNFRFFRRGDDRSRGIRSYVL